MERFERLVSRLDSLVGPRRPSGRRLCRAPQCRRRTTERKPYCIDHLDRLPYVRWLRRELAERAAEASAAARPGGSWAVREDGSCARDIVAELARGARTVERLARAADLSVRALQGYVAALERMGVVRVLKLGSLRSEIREVVVLEVAKERRSRTAAAS